MPPAGLRFLLPGRLRRRSLAAAIEADMHSFVVSGHRLFVDVCNRKRSKVVHGAIVRQRTIFPTAALITVACITIAIVYPAIEADLICPISGMKSVAVVDPAPIG